MGRKRKVVRNRDGIVIRDQWTMPGRWGRGKRWLAMVWQAGLIYTSQRTGRQAKQRGRYARAAFDSEAEAKAWAEKRQHEIGAGVASAKPGRVEEIGKLYTATLSAQGCSDDHVKQVGSVINILLRAGASNFRDAEFEVKTLGAINHLTVQRKGQKKPTPAGAVWRRRVLTIARSLARFAVAKGGAERNPLEITKLGRLPKSSKRVFTVDELRILVGERGRWNLGDDVRAAVFSVEKHGGDKRAAAAELNVNLATVYNRLHAASTPRGEDPWWLFTCLATYLGTRPTETRHLGAQMIDRANRDLIMPANHPGNKTRVERRIPIPDELWPLIKDRVGTFLPKEIVGMREDACTKAFQRYVERCGLDSSRRGPHTLRHNCGALQTAMGVQPVLVLLHLGHTDPKVSQEYARSAPAFKAAVEGWDKCFRLRARQAADAHVTGAASHSG